MPWREASTAGEQRRFIAARLRGEAPVAALCQRFGISRKTGYKRINRCKVWGYAGLGGPQSGPAPPPLATSAEVARQVIAVKRAHPTWGSKKGVAWLRAAWSTPFTAATVANDVWGRDFKGWFRTTDGPPVQPPEPAAGRCCVPTRL